MDRVSHKEEYIEEIDLRDILRTIWKWKYMIASVTFLLIAGTAIYSYLIMEPVYESRTQIEVGKPILEISSDNQMDSLINQLLEGDMMTLDAFSSKITSPDVLKEVINKLNLSVNPDELETMIKVNVEKDKQLITIIVDSNDSKVSAKIANALKGEAIQQSKRANDENMNLIKKGIEELLQKEDEKLQLAIQKSNAHLLNTNSTAYLDILLSAKISSMEEYTHQLSDAEIEREQLNKGIQQLQIILANTPEITTETSYIEGAAVGQIPVMESGTKTIKTEKSSEVYDQALIDYNNKLTRLAEIGVKIQMLRELLANQEQEIIQGNTDLLQNKLEQQPLQNEIDRIQSNINWLNDKQAEVNNIIEFDLDDNLITTIKEASPPADPINPNKELNVLIAFILGLMISLFAAFFLEYIARPKNEVSD